MKVLLIRHGKVDMEWEKTYTSEEYDNACSMYDEADIVPIDHPQETGDYKKIYVSSLKRAIRTAEQMFPSASTTVQGPSRTLPRESCGKYLSKAL